MQPVFEKLLRLKDGDRSRKSSRGMTARDALNQRAAPPNNASVSKVLTPASLVIIDRFEDIYTPTSYAGALPIAHRVLSTLRHHQHDCEHNRRLFDDSAHRSTEKSINDVISRVGAPKAEARRTYPAQLHSYQPTDVDAFAHPLPANLTPNTLQQTTPRLQTAMSGLLGLPLPMKPTILCKSQTTCGADHASSLCSYLFLRDESESRPKICETLQLTIADENGSLPPSKKRGFGAEMLALTQALIESPGRPSKDHEHAHSLQLLLRSVRFKYNIFACMRHQSLLGVCMSVVEAMQRSSSKQFAQVCSWQCSFDARVARDELLTKALASSMGDIDSSFQQLKSHFKRYAIPEQHVLTPTGSTGKPLKQKDKEAADAGPVDIVLWLLQLFK